MALAPGGFQILRVLSRSPHSRVYLAHSPEGQRVALKELVFHLAPDIAAVDAFEREARVLATLEHARIPRFLKSFCEGSGVHQRFYLAQDYVAGITLADALRTRQFSAGEAESLTRDLLRVVGYLHRQRPPLIHRDIKPANLILREDGNLVLVDFGIARGLERGLTHNATLVGTFGYMAPEQLGGTVSPQSDLYAVGVTVLELLTRRPPSDFLGDGLTLEGWQEQVPELWRPWLERMLARTSSARFASATEASIALGRAAQRKPRPKLRPTRFLAYAGMAVTLAFFWARAIPVILNFHERAPVIVAAPAARLASVLQTLQTASTDQEKIDALVIIDNLAHQADSGDLSTIEVRLTNLSYERLSASVRAAWLRAIGTVSTRSRRLFSSTESALARVVMTGDDVSSKSAYGVLRARSDLGDHAVDLLRAGLKEDLEYRQARYVIRLLVLFDHTTTVEDALSALDSAAPVKRWWGYARLSVQRPPSEPLVAQVRRLAKQANAVPSRDAARSLLVEWGVALPNDPPPAKEADL